MCVVEGGGWGGGNSKNYRILSNFMSDLHEFIPKEPKMYEFVSVGLCVYVRASE